MVNILVVEDDIKLNQIVCAQLEKNGYSVSGCNTPEEAYDVMYKSFYDMIISDIMLPKTDGFEFLENVRKINKNIPLLCFGIIDLKYIDICIENNITITVSNIDYLNELLKLNLSNLKVHLKLNTGMNRLGFKKQEEVTYAYNALLNSSINPLLFLG